MIALHSGINQPQQVAMHVNSFLIAAATVRKRPFCIDVLDTPVSTTPDDRVPVKLTDDIVIGIVYLRYVATGKWYCFHILRSRVEAKSHHRRI